MKVDFEKLFHSCHYQVRETIDYILEEVFSEAIAEKMKRDLRISLKTDQNDNQRGSWYRRNTERKMEYYNRPDKYQQDNPDEALEYIRIRATYKGRTRSVKIYDGEELPKAKIKKKFLEIYQVMEDAEKQRQKKKQQKKQIKQWKRDVRNETKQRLNELKVGGTNNANKFGINTLNDKTVHVRFSNLSEKAYWELVDFVEQHQDLFKDD